MLVVSTACWRIVVLSHRVLPRDQLMVAWVMAVRFLGKTGRCVACFAFVEEGGLVVIRSEFMLIQTARLLFDLCCACSWLLRQNYRLGGSCSSFGLFFTSQIWMTRGRVVIMARICLASRFSMSGGRFVTRWDGSRTAVWKPIKLLSWVVVDVVTIILTERLLVIKNDVRGHSLDRATWIRWLRQHHHLLLRLI